MGQETDTLGENLAGMQQGQDNNQEDAFPDSQDANLLIAPFDQFGFSMTVIGTAKFYADDSFVLDNDPRGDLDSPIYKLDGGYAITTYGYTFPATFPMTFADLGTGDTILFTYNA